MQGRAGQPLGPDECPRPGRGCLAANPRDRQCADGGAQRRLQPGEPDRRLGSLNPLAFATPGTAQQLTLNFQLPLNRLAQRNAYRTAIINYQQARRNLMSLEDSIAAQVRFDVRQLHLYAENYKIQQKLLQSLYSQVESTLEVIVAPVDPDQLKQTGTTGQANAAALTNQYLTALSSLNNAQTKMYDIWLSYLATRMELYQDLESLPLDNRGVWIDELGNTADLPPCRQRKPGPREHPPCPRTGSRTRRALPSPGSSRLPRAQAWSKRKRGLTFGPGPVLIVVGGPAPGPVVDRRAAGPCAVHRAHLDRQAREAEGDHRRPRQPGVGEERRHRLQCPLRHQGQHHRPPSSG